MGDRDRGIMDGFCRDTQYSMVSIFLSAKNEVTVPEVSLGRKTNKHLNVSKKT